jgi:cell division protein ZapA (FtsZ GTPase activity inhibitor)
MPLNQPEAENTVTKVRVEIYDQVYNLRAAADGERVKRISRLVDRRMREIADQMTTLDTMKIAVLAALNLADELDQLREENAYRQAPGVEAGPETPTPPSPAEDREGWSYEDIFEPLPADRNVEKLGEQISARLQSRRFSIRDDDPIHTESEG